MTREKKPMFSLFSDSHNNHGSLVMFSKSQSCPEKKMIKDFKAMPNVDYLSHFCGQCGRHHVKETVEGYSLHQAFIPIPLSLFYNYDRKTSEPYDCSLLFSIFTEVWSQVKATKVIFSLYVKALLKFCIVPIYNTERNEKQVLEGFKFTVISSTAKTYKTTLQIISVVVETHDKKLLKEEEDTAIKQAVIAKSQETSVKMVKSGGVTS